MTKLATQLSSVPRVGLDLAKNVFQVHAVDAAGIEIDKRALRRAKLLDYFAALLPLVARLRDIEEALDDIDKRIALEAKANPDARLLMTIPGVGPIKAAAIVATIGEAGIHQLSGAKNFAAWLGLRV